VLVAVSGNPARFKEHFMSNGLFSTPAPVSLMVEEAPGVYRSASDQEVVSAAQTVLAKALRNLPLFDSPMAVRDYLRMRLGILSYEVFGVLVLDSQNRLIDWVELFRGTLTQTSVYPREVVKLAIQMDAAAVILVHNHPSGTAQPSRADEALTQTLKSALSLVDVRVLDHFIVTAGSVASMAEMGLV
jgi:DNA repair protein RadC